MNLLGQIWLDQASVFEHVLCEMVLIVDKCHSKLHWCWNLEAMVTLGTEDSLWVKAVRNVGEEELERGGLEGWMRRKKQERSPGWNFYRLI